MPASPPGRRPGHRTRASPRTPDPSCRVTLPASPDTGWQAGRRDGAEHRGRGTRTLERGRPEVQHVDGPAQDPRFAAGAELEGERATLPDYLRAYRLALELKCAGLDAEQLARQAGCGFHGSGQAASRSWTEAAMILLRWGIPVGLRRVLACSCADCRDAAAHRAE